MRLVRRRYWMVSGVEEVYDGDEELLWEVEEIEAHFVLLNC
jgi:hypothetical protein